MKQKYGTSGDIGSRWGFGGRAVLDIVAHRSETRTYSCTQVTDQDI